MPAEAVTNTVVSIRRPPKLSARYPTAKLPIALNTNIAADNPAALVGEYPMPVRYGIRWTLMPTSAAANRSTAIAIIQNDHERNASRGSSPGTATSAAVGATPLDT